MMQFPNIQAEELVVGKNVVIHPTAKITGVKGEAKRIVIGDNTFIGADVQIMCDEFSIGDYGKIHHHTNIHGYKPCTIGHNAWIGQYCIIDSIGGTSIGNNCGIGAHSQLWSHIKFGDMLEGCRFLSESPLELGNDVWLVGHCIVSPIRAADKSMALAGSVITQDMAYNTIYGGTPARSLSGKTGFQFNEVSIHEKFQKMQGYLQDWCGDKSGIAIITDDKERADPRTVTYFNVANRTYNKRLTADEISFMQFLLPEKAKFIPA